MADNWPATLPKMMQVDGYAEGSRDGRLISQMDAGPAKVRRRSSAMPKPLQARMILSDDQWDDLVEFVDDTLIGGTLPFNFPQQPWDGATTILVRFSGALPSKAPHGNTEAWMVALDLEVLP